MSVDENKPAGENGAQVVPIPLPNEATQYGTLKITDLPEVQASDDSKITDRKKASDIFDTFVSQVGTWLKGTRLVGGASAALCKLSFDLRELCLRPDGQIDWAGNTDAYKVVYSNRLGHVYRELGLSKTEQDKIANNVRVWNSDNDYARVRMAQWAVTHVEPLAKLADKVGPGKPLPTEVAKELRNMAGKQKTVSGKDVRGFTPAGFAASGEIVGVKKSAAKKEKTTDNASSMTPSAHWEAMRLQVVKREKGKPTLALTTQASELHALISAIAVAVVGEPGKPVPSIANKAEVVTTLTMCRDTLSATLAVLTEEKNKSDVLAPTLFDAEKVA